MRFVRVPIDSYGPSGLATISLLSVLLLRPTSQGYRLGLTGLRGSNAATFGHIARNRLARRPGVTGRYFTEAISRDALRASACRTEACSRSRERASQNPRFERVFGTLNDEMSL